MNVRSELTKSILFLFLIDPCVILTNEIGLNPPGSKKRKKKNFNIFHNRYTEVNIIGDEFIDIEFFEESESIVEINVLNSENKNIYALEIFTAPTLHIVIKCSDWSNDIYTILIKNEHFDFTCDFILENSFV